jgi:hypothetical protein
MVLTTGKLDVRNCAVTHMPRAMKFNSFQTHYKEEPSRQRYTILKIARSLRTRGGWTPPSSS